jgi:hypothetical protein
MESLESKLDRLSPEQRSEVEEFVDFLLYRLGLSHDESSQTVLNLLASKSAQSLIPVMAPIMIQETPPFVMSEQNIRQEEPSSIGMSDEHSIPMQEIAVEVEDLISRDYMDYGQFEQQSPATEAVREVKTKLILKSDQDTSRNLLDWID